MKTQLPLKGVRILDLSHMWSGPYCTALLGSMGAEVIKVESIQHMDMYRLGRRPPGDSTGWETSPVWNGTNLNKLGCTLNLRSRRGRELFLRLAALSDVVIENFSSRVLGSLGLEYPTLRQENPAIVLVSMPPFGKEGSWKDNVGMAFMFEGMSGAIDATGYPDEESPYDLGGACDAVVGYMTSFAILSALVYRRDTGQGQYIELSQTDTFATVHGQRIVNYVTCGMPSSRMGNSHTAMAPHGCYPCAGEDSYITITVCSDEEWDRLVVAMGKPEWAVDRVLKTVIGRLARREYVDRRVAQWTREQDPWKLMQQLQRAGVTAAAVRKPEELPQDVHMQRRGFFQVLTRDIVGAHEYQWYGFKVSGTENRHQTPAPLLGEHTWYVLENILGLSSTELERLAQEEVIGHVPKVAS